MSLLPILDPSQAAASKEGQSKGTYAFVNEEANAAMTDVQPQPKLKTATTFSLINP